MKRVLGALLVVGLMGLSMASAEPVARYPKARVVRRKVKKPEKNANAKKVVAHKASKRKVAG